jgi:hypothetical protein
MFRQLAPAAKQAAKSALKYATVITPLAYAYNKSPQAFQQHFQSFTSIFPVAHAASAWQPHPELPPPTTMKEAIGYNDYAPGYSEALPDYSNLPPMGVKKVVASNLEEHILDPNKDVFVQFSQEKCPSCQSFQRITDAMSFAFRDVPSIQFLEIKGTGNYVPGILTSEEEVLYPTFKFFPGGNEKIAQMQRAKDFVKMVREYNTKLLSEHNPDEPVPPHLEPALAKSRFEGVGFSMPMSAGADDEYVWDTFINVMWDQAKVKFDKDAVKKQIEIIEPALKREISHTIRANLPGYELLGSLSPCGSEWDAFQDTMLRRGVGSTKTSEFYSNMTTLRQCLTDRYPLENAFWKEMMKVSIHMCKTLDVVQQAKKHEGLTHEQAHEFFKQYSKSLQLQDMKVSKSDDAKFSNIPRRE